MSLSKDFGGRFTSITRISKLEKTSLPEPSDALILTVSVPESEYDGS